MSVAVEIPPDWSADDVYDFIEKVGSMSSNPFKNNHHERYEMDRLIIEYTNILFREEHTTCFNISSSGITMKKFKKKYMNKIYLGGE